MTPLCNLTAWIYKFIILHFSYIPIILLLIIFILCSDKIFFLIRISWKMLLRKQWHIACARLNMAGPWNGLCRGNVLSIGISRQIPRRLPNVSYVKFYKTYCESWYYIFMCREDIRFSNFFLFAFLDVVLLVRGPIVSS